MVDTADISLVTKVEKDEIYNQFKTGEKITVSILKSRNRSPTSFNLNLDFSLLKVEAADEDDRLRTCGLPTGSETE